MFSAIPFPLRYDQLARFADNLSVSLAAGVELRQAIRTSSGSLVKTVPAFREVWERVDQGEHLSEALRAVESQLPRFVLPVVESGECSGRLIESLRFLSTHLRMLERPTTALRNAWLLPLAILTVGQGLTAALLFLVGTWSQATAAATELLMTGGTVAAFAVLLILTPLRVLWDKAKLLLPVVATIERELAVNRFLHVFALLEGTGSQRVEWTIRRAARTIGNHWLRQELLRAAVQIERGTSLTETFSEISLFSRDDRSELAVAEAAGQVPETCERLAVRAGESAAARLEWITFIAVRVTMGLAVMTMAAALAPWIATVSRWGR